MSLDIQGSEGSECTHNVSLDIQRSEEVSALIMIVSLDIQRSEEVSALIMIKFH